MATVTAIEAQAGIQPKGSRVAGVIAVTTFYSLTSSGSVGTIIQMIKVPQGATVVGGFVSTNHAGQLTVQVGDGLVNDRYYLETTLSAGMGGIQLFSNLSTPANNRMAYTYSQDDTIDIIVSRVSVSTLGGAFFLTLLFTMDARTPGLPGA